MNNEFPRAPIYSEMIQTWNAQLIFQKQQEYMAKVKKDIPFSDENLMKESSKDKNELGGKVYDVKMMEDGTLRTYIVGRRQPLTGYSDSQMVNILAIIKHLFALELGELGSMKIFKRAIALLGIIYSINIFSKWFERMFRFLPLLLKDEHWARCVKEIRRVLKGKTDDNLIDAISFLIEFDSAYRNRMRDIIVELDQSKLHGFSANKEVSRLFDILIGRDYPEMRPKWRKLKQLTQIMLLIPKTRKLIISILKEINLKEMMFSEEELWWIRQFPSYNWLGLELVERLEINKQIYGGTN